MKSNKLIFSPWFDRQEFVINYLDVGARGDVSEPWSLFSQDSIKVIGFEPDPTECDRLSRSYPGRKYYPNALWGEKATRPFYLCEWGSTSSMYPPAELSNRQYQSAHWTGRVPAKILQVECVTLDSILTPEDSPDFIKIDTQGAELQILHGAERLLRQGTPLVLAETWCAEIYAGMPLTHDVMAFMHQLGYQVFDLNVAAAWRHKNEEVSDVYCKAKTIGFDLLFVKRLDQLQFHNESELIKFSAICELFGFRDYAIAVLSQSPIQTDSTAEAYREILRNEKQDRIERSFWRRIFKHLFRRRINPWPNLH